MAPDKKDKKRKAAAAAAADSPAKKTKKVEAKPAESPKDAPKSILKKANQKESAAKTDGASKAKANGQPARQIKPRKRAADFLSDNDNSDSEAEVAETKVQKEEKPTTKKSKKEDGTAAPATKSKPAKTNTKAKKAEPVPEESEEEDESAASDASQSEDEEDDRTAALIKGFESSGDEDESGDEGFNPDQPVPKIPDSKKAKRKILKKQKENAGQAEEPGTVYVGRIPHGFYEHQMRAYFSQFGDITRLRLSRNRITGRSKHYAFIEFASTSVAKIVAATMDNYLMYGHILKCKYVSPEQLHPEVWKGANRRFKRTPWNRIEKKRLDKGKTREQWTERIEREQKRRLAKAEKLKAIMGYDLDIPQLKSVDEVPVQEAKAIEASEPAAEEPAKAIEAAPVEEPKAEKPAEDTPKKTNKKTKKAAQSPAVQETPKSAEKSTPKKTTEEAASPAAQKAKKVQKKTKAKSKA
ncbi:hypothetical protein CBS63078_5317 [Aspergillus niger]|uniref:RRM domain-containing protein n=1 Tax=Aspergillus welwitschiae TaxID=1341132 RepID=A0A3F3Q4V6_9EURO|nr:uncharacterized protein BO96DRAFT_415043 [Aspergillus niger CBS 101883]XP_026627271.1 hypothetical protein BDQ94DRAFT_142375 [Aspergillus welwitschiae]KAI2830142.1 hypothetical protein CBS133816_3737 [Aspergillus niger]KAI2850935.1 hypothetical protein CBS11350_1527 [Aspergillus niger]KAI2897268.1 hypothetical protein CBS13152_3011 [Aspergillus niger]KAI2905398.1 hypothetical protein CBS63078_5317 [Aspergillus niger]KAI2917779.1 hypothetical protein CBS147320_9135 [Aspergillus niger]